MQNVEGCLEDHIIITGKVYQRGEAKGPRRHRHVSERAALDIVHHAHNVV